MLLGSLQAACNLDVIEEELGVSVTVPGAQNRGCPEHDGGTGCRRARFGSAAASSDRFKVLQDNIGTDKSFS